MEPSMTVTEQSSLRDSSTAEYGLEEGLLLAIKEEEEGRRSPLMQWLARNSHLAGELAEFLAASGEFRSKVGPFEGPACNSDSGFLVEGIELLGEIEQGGMGIVYRGYDHNLKCEVAIKRLKKATLGPDEHWTRFQFEAEVVASLDHPNILRVNSFGVANGSPYLVMPLMKGGSLSKYLKALGPDRCLEPKKAAELIRKIALGVHHAHQRGLIHRDLKPGNILLDGENQPHVADFGLAKRLEDGEGLSVSGSIAGTAAYMAPEQARGEKGLTIAADIHALGAILYELLTGEPPFGKGELMPTLKRVNEEEPRSVRKIRPKVPADLEAICMKCLEKHKRDRYRTAEELADDLDHFIHDEAVAARPPGFWDWLRQMMRTRPHPNYSWEVPAWLGVLLLISNFIIYGLCQSGSSAGWIWINNIGCATGIFIVFWWYMLRRFRDIPLTERHSLVIGVGHTLAHLGLMIAYLPFSFSTPARDYLMVYPAIMALTGLGLFTIGSTNWSRFFPVGLLVIGLTPLTARWPDESPLIFGITSAALLWYWTIAKKVYFGNRPAETT